MILLETITPSLGDALVAEAGGADRFELCSALSLGGLTPSLGTLQEIKASCKVPVMCMIRPRQGGMAYSKEEFKVMQTDAELALEAGADGLVFGFLTDDGDVDTERCRIFSSLAEQALPSRLVHTVFHRAFDVTRDPATALEQLVDVGISRILTSGTEAEAIQGITRIRHLVELARGRIEILPGGGIDESNVRRIVVETGVQQVHLHLPGSAQDRSVLHNPSIYFGAHQNELEYPIVDGRRVQEVRTLLDGTTRESTSGSRA